MKLIYINYISTEYNPSSSYSIFCVCVSCHPLNTKCGWLAWNQETPVSILLQRKEAKTSFFVRSIILNHRRKCKGRKLLIVNLKEKKTKAYNTFYFQNLPQTKFRLVKFWIWTMVSRDALWKSRQTTVRIIQNL